MRELEDEVRAEDAFQGHVHVPDQPAPFVTLVGPVRGQPRAGERVQDEQAGDDRHHPAVGAAHGFHEQQDQGHAEHDVEPFRRRVAVGEVVSAHQHVDDNGHRQCRHQPVPPHHTVAISPCDRKPQERDEQHHRHMHRAKGLGRHDAVGGIQVEHRHQHRGQRDDDQSVG